MDRSGEASKTEGTLESTSQLQLVEFDTLSSTSADSAVIPTLASAGECRFLILLAVKTFSTKLVRIEGLHINDRNK